MVPNVLGELFAVLGTAEGSSSEVFVIFHRLFQGNLKKL